MNNITTDVVTYVPEYTYVSHRTYKISWFLIFSGMLLIALAAYHFYLFNNILKLKKRCTQVYSAEITAIHKKKNPDPHLRSRYMQYSATYRYEYDGQFYECSNNVYDVYRFRKPKVGDIATIYIDPQEPSCLFDDFAKSKMNSFLITGIMLSATGLLCIFGDIIANLL